MIGAVDLGSEGESMTGTTGGGGGGLGNVYEGADGEAVAFPRVEA